MITSPDFNITIGGLLWLGILLVIVFTQRAQATLGVGLVLAYYLNLALIHVPGALLYLDPDYGFYKRSWIDLGFEQSTYAILAFGVGAMGTLWFLRQTRIVPPMSTDEVWNSGLLFNPWLHRLYVAVGLVSFLIVTPLARNVPTFSAVVSVLNQLLLVGICMGIWNAWRSGRIRELGFWVLTLGGMPVLTIVFQGFIGYGTVALMTGLSFLASFFRPRWLILVVGIVFVVVGASAFVTYFRDRTEIRKVVWGNESLEERAVTVLETFGEFEWFDPSNRRHVNSVDARLNQNWIVGAAMENLENGGAEFKSGSTIVDAAISIIPRAIWADKPTRAGSGSLVTDATGVEFAKNTSIGVGQVLEFYFNFGTVGVVVGSFLWGVALSLLDSTASRYLIAGDARQFTIYYLIGLGLIQPGGSLVDVAATAAAAVVAALVVNDVLVPFFVGGFQEEEAPAQGNVPAPAARPAPPRLPSHPRELGPH